LEDDSWLGCHSLYCINCGCRIGNLLKEKLCRKVDDYLLSAQLFDF